MSEADKEAAKKSKEVEAMAAEAYRKEREKIKLLLLGAGESGQSLAVRPQDCVDFSSNKNPLDSAYALYFSQVWSHHP